MAILSVFFLFWTTVHFKNEFPPPHPHSPLLHPFSGDTDGRESGAGQRRSGVHSNYHKSSDGAASVFDDYDSYEYDSDDAVVNQPAMMVVLTTAVTTAIFVGLLRH